ncbi:single-stranded-DNA-specific exonuclease RecJ [Methylophaga sp. OBS4]|uniref:single-stranded-DNA-specific exonuclease RecJ n=1 Tax=Methylophaga sp. OBS4 TaxID=2991935 RepID=UPI00224D3211|nr:single-stranded-DNA-specific exonuclease RecJ [Methylophaga sp. OBS4]MCX4188166.1 single-stranded-DNA-specific exonuclease RecJ [Methylophaga sp. OBS4]
MNQIQIIERDCNGWQQLPDSWPDCLRRVMAARGVKQVDLLTYELADLPRPQQMLGMEQAVILLSEALEQQWKVTVVADFDSDGATSCALAMRGLKAMGLQQIDFIVPNRFIHGYGLTPELLNDIPLEDQPDLLLTVDNGIAAVAGVAAARQRGIKVLVTDHHLAGEQLPAAEAIINPNQPGDEFPSKNMAGVGVCFYLLLGLRQHLRDAGWFESQQLTEPRLIDWLDIVALGTVADVVPLDQLNRTLVDMGLKRIRRGMGCAGIRALAQIAGRETASLASPDLGYSIAPRLNAAGRMEDMGLGIALLLSDDFEQSLTLATMLDQINLERRSVEQNMQQDALAMLAKLDLQDAEKAPGYCLFDPDWHQGVIGLLASRIKEKLHRPVIAFAPGNEGEIKGSARSIPGVHIRDVLARVAANNPALLQRFGGHAMAAGMTIKADDLAEFTALFEQALTSMVEPEVYLQTLHSDGELAGAEINLQLAEMLPQAAPWGQGFEEPRFHGCFMVEDWRLVGQESDHLRLSLRLNDNSLVTAMAFRQQKPDWLQTGRSVLIRYRLAVNEFRDNKSLQFLVDDLLQPV